MLNFINSQGKKVLEMKDDGTLEILDGELKESFEKAQLTVEEQLKKKDGSKDGI